MKRKYRQSFSSVLWCTFELNGLSSRAGIWFYVSVVDWMLKCGRGTQKSRWMNTRARFEGVFTLVVRFFWSKNENDTLAVHTVMHLLCLYIWWCMMDLRTREELIKCGKESKQRQEFLRHTRAKICCKMQFWCLYWTVMDNIASTMGKTRYAWAFCPF